MRKQRRKISLQLIFVCYRLNRRGWTFFKQCSSWVIARISTLKSIFFTLCNCIGTRGKRRFAFYISWIWNWAFRNIFDILVTYPHWNSMSLSFLVFSLNWMHITQVRQIYILLVFDPERNLQCALCHKSFLCFPKYFLLHFFLLFAKTE